MGTSQAPPPHHELTGEAGTLKCLSAPGDILHPHTQTSAACCPHKDPLKPLLPDSVLLPPPKLGGSPPYNSDEQRSLNQESWIFGLCCVPGGKVLPPTLA